MHQQPQLGGAGFQRALPVALDVLRVCRKRRHGDEARDR